MILSNLLLFVGVLFAGFAAYVAARLFFDNFFNQSSNQALSWASGEEPRASKSPVIRITRPLVHRLAVPIASKWQLKNYRERIKREIQGAGLAAELNADEYVGLQLLLGLMVPLLILSMNLLFNLNYPVWMIFLFAFAGFFFPYMYVRGTKEQRRAQVLVDLPFVIDLLALSTEAGLDFIGAISKVVEKMSGGALAEELAQVLRDLKLGSSRVEALNAMAWRLNMGEVSSFIAVLVTADSLGASIGGVLRQQSEQMRQERFVRAEKAGVEASQKIFIPLILFIMPAVLLMVFGPVLIEFMGTR